MTPYGTRSRILSRILYLTLDITLEMACYRTVAQQGT